MESYFPIPPLQHAAPSEIISLGFGAPQKQHDKVFFCNRKRKSGKKNHTQSFSAGRTLTPGKKSQDPVHHFVFLVDKI